MENAVRPPSTPPPPALPVDGDPDLIGKVVGDFRILRKLGQGGMGQVFLAEQLSLKRQVALKIMRPDLAANATALRRFQLEAEAVARINHANIVQVHAFGVADGMHFMALEYVEGKNLREYLARKGSPELKQGLSILRQVAAALQRAGELGIIHRDIKPENILLTRKGEAKVTDFGLSRCLVAEQNANLTQSGVTMGTPLYMSPEQVQGKETDPRTDIYSLGVTCYHMFAGHPPYRGQTAIEVALQHVQASPVPLSEVRPDLPIELCQIIHKMMAKAPAERYQTAGDLLKDVTRLRSGLSGMQTQGISLSQIGPLGLAPASSVKLPTLRLPKPAAARSRRWLALAFVASLLLAAGAGALLRWQWTPTVAGPNSTPAERPSDGPVVRDAPRIDPHEAALVEALRKTPRSAEEYRQHLDQAIQLATLYLDQRRLDEAEKLFQSLNEKTDRAQLQHALGRIGQPIVLAFRGQAKQSNDLFLELEKKKPKADTPLGPLLIREFPEYTLLQRGPVRRLVAEAINQNATNLEPEPLPEPLDRLRKLPLRAN